MKPHLVRLGIEEPMRFWEHVDDLVAPEPPPAPPLPVSKPQRHGR